MYRFENYVTGKRKFAVALIFVAFSSIIIAMSLDIRRLIDTEIQRFQSLHPTFSDLLQLVDEGDTVSSLRNLTLYDYNKLFYKLSKIYLRDLLVQKEHSPNPVVNITIKFKNLQKIYADRENAINIGVLDNAQEVPCQILYNGIYFDCHARLKGDLKDHWDAKERLSLRIRLKNGYIFGMNKFSIQKPRARQYPYDFAYQELIGKLGCLSNRNQRFASVTLNGKSWGVLNFEEADGYKYLERRSEKLSSIFRISDQKSWVYSALDSSFDEYYISDPTVTLGVRGNDKEFFSKSQNRFIYSKILSKLRDHDGSVFDREKMLINFFAALVWGSTHTLYNSNMRYYWNPYTEKLEPVSGDQAAWRRLDQLKLEGMLSDLPFEYQILFSTQPLTKKELDLYIDMVKRESKDLLAIINDNKRSNFVDDSLFKVTPFDNNSELLKNNSANVLKILNMPSAVKSNNKSASITDEMAQKLEDIVKVAHYDNGVLSITNLVGDSVEVESYTVDGVTHYVGQTINKSTKYNLSQLELKTRYTGNYDGKIFVKTSLKSHSKVSVNTNTIPYYNKRNKHTEDQLIYCSKIADESCIISKSMAINSDIEFTRHVNVNEGVEIKLMNDADIVFLNGVTFKGAQSNPIRVRGDKTGGIAIINQNKSSASSLKNVEFSYLSTVKTESRSYTGAINVYGGQIEIKNVSISNNSSEDQINLVKTDVNIENLAISRAPSDALDCDYCSGHIDKLRVEKIGGDGLDVSGSKLLVSHLFADDVKDKALSVGENSDITLESGYFKNVSTGIAVKDSSRAIVESVTMANVLFDPFMTYIKKPYFEGITSLVVKNYNVTSFGGLLCVREIGTELKVRFADCPATDLRVDELYKTRMKK